MRTNIVIDDQLIAQAMRLTRSHTKRDVVDLALRRLVQLEQQRAVLDLAGPLVWQVDLPALRESRPPASGE